MIFPYIGFPQGLKYGSQMATMSAVHNGFYIAKTYCHKSLNLLMWNRLVIECYTYEMNVSIPRFEGEEDDRCEMRPFLWHLLPRSTSRHRNFNSPCMKICNEPSCWLGEAVRTSRNPLRCEYQSHLLWIRIRLVFLAARSWLEHATLGIFGLVSIWGAKFDLSETKGCFQGWAT